MDESKQLTRVNKDLQKNKEYLQYKLGADVSLDVVIREFKIGSKDAVLCYFDPFSDDQIVTLIMQTFMNVDRQEIVPNTYQKILQKAIPYTELTPEYDMQSILEEILAGPMALFIDGEDQAIILDTRSYPARDPEEPETERVTRGSRDGFVETLMFNIGLLRRRVRDPNLRVEGLRVGERSKSDIALLYMDDITNPDIIDNIRQKINAIDIDGLPMAEKSIEEYLVGEFWNPFPQVRFTERPDVAATHLFEGHVVIMVDTSPVVIIAPVTLFNLTQHAEEYRETALIGTYLRWARFIGIFISLFLVPTWLLFTLEPELLPEGLEFIGPEEIGPIPIFIQFLIAHIFIDLIRMASIHTPSPLAIALSLVAALLIGEIAIEVGLFVEEVLLYVSIVAIGMFTTPSHELQLANRVVQLFLLVLTGLFSLPGFLLGLLIMFVILVITNSFGVPYLWPLIPLDFKALMSVIFRKPVPLKNYSRPKILEPKDSTRRGE